MNKQKGQTAIEYLLIMVVSIGIALTFYKKLNEFMLKNPNSFVSRSLSTLANRFNQDSSGRYRNYSIR